MAKTIEIEVSITSNTLIVGVNGGNVTAEPGDHICWRAGQGVKAVGSPGTELEFAL